MYIYKDVYIYLYIFTRVVCVDLHYIFFIYINVLVCIYTYIFVRVVSVDLQRCTFLCFIYEGLFPDLIGLFLDMTELFSHDSYT